MKTKLTFFNSFTLFLVLLAVYTGTFAGRDIIDVDIMEARNYVAAREMADGGSLLIPTMNGELRIAKPPLPTWFTAAAVYAAGTDNAMDIMRIPSAIAGVLMLAGIYLLSGYFSGSKRVAYNSVLVLSTSFLFMLMSRKNTWDIYSHAFMIAGLATLFHAHFGQVRNKVYWYAFTGVMLAASFMSKGPVSFYTVLLPVIIAAVFTFPVRPFLKENYGKLLLCIVITVFLSSLWPVYVFMHETHSALSTVMAESAAWTNRHVKPFWYYIQFPLMSGLWSIILVPLLYPKFAFKRINPVRAKFYLIWLYAALVLLSLIAEKKDRYLLPVVIPSALLVGEYLAAVTGRLLLKRPDRYIVGVWVILSFAALCGAFAATAYFQIIHPQESWLYYSFSAVSAVLALAVSIYQMRKYGLLRSVPYAVMCFCLTFILSTPFIKIPEQDFRALEKVRTTASLKHFSDFYGDLGIKEIWAVGRRVLPSEEIPAGTSDAMYVAENGDEVIPAGYDAKKVAVYGIKHGRSWTFYRLTKRFASVKEK